MTTPTPPPLEARNALADALKALGDKGIRYYDLGDDVDPPGVLVSLPVLTWSSYATEPTAARFSVFLVAAPDDRAIEYLLSAYAVVAEAVESYPDATVTAASPAVWRVGSTDLPAYEITTEVAL